jgi:hypothetical protein
MRPGRHLLRHPSWQYPHRNLTCMNDKTYEERSMNALHAICFLYKGIDHIMLLLLFPSSHVSVHVYNPFDVVLNVMLLSTFVVQGNGKES